MQPRSPSPLPNSKPPSLSRDDLFFFFRLQKKKRKEKERESQLFVNRTQLLLANQIKSHPTVAAFFAIPLSSSAAAAAAAADAADSPPLPSPPVSASPPSAAWGSRSRFAPPLFPLLSATPRACNGLLRGPGSRDLSLLGVTGALGRSSRRGGPSAPPGIREGPTGLAVSVSGLSLPPLLVEFRAAPVRCPSDRGPSAAAT
jgi:hypothetical protein